MLKKKVYFNRRVRRQKLKLRKYKLKRRYFRFKKRQKFLFIKFIRRRLRKTIKNYELLKHPLLMKFFFSLKYWTKPKLKSWRYFFSKRSMYFQKATPKLGRWRRFRFFVKKRLFWFNNLTKRQFLILKGLYRLDLKGSKENNYLRLRKKFIYFIKKKNKFRNWLEKSFDYIKLKRYSDLLKLYIHILINKRNKNILNVNLKLINLNIFKIFSKLYIFIFFIKQCTGYLYKLYKHSSLYNDIQIYRKYVYIKSKWLNRIKRRGRYIYRTQKLKRKARFFSKLKKKVFFFFDLNKIKDQFFRIKVKTVDTNLFLTLTNYKHEVIIYKSTGQVSENRKKKTKLSPFTISRLAVGIIKKIRNLKIQYIILNINTRMNKNIRNIFRSIKNAVRVKIVEANYSRPIPHHFGTRKAKPKRL